MSSTQKRKSGRQDAVAIEIDADEPLEIPATEQDIASVGAASESLIAPDAGDEESEGSARRSVRADEIELCADVPLTTRVEAVLMSTERPLTEGRIAALLGLGGKGAVKRVTGAIEELNAQYEASGRAFRAERLAGGWQLLTLASLGPILNRLHADRQQSRLSQPALETLAIIAYRQPIMRAEVEAIRGVAAGEVLRGLLERRLVKIVGRAEELGRPMLYGTTTEFLKVFGLSGVDDLPAVKGLAPQLRAKTAKAVPAPTEAEQADAAPGMSAESAAGDPDRSDGS